MKRVLAVAALLLGVAGMSIGSAGLAAAQGPGGKGNGAHGNSGTVKIDQTPLSQVGKKDTANHPHVSCEFTVSFWGFDEGTHATDVLFTAQPPSGHGQTVPALLSPTVFTFTGKEPGSSLDTQKTYKLDVTGLKANPQQGFHIKVETDFTGTPELDKYKVFWYEPCGVPPTTTTTTQPKEPTTTEAPTTTTSSTSTSTTSTTLTPTSSTTPEGGTTTTSTTLPGATTTTPTTSTGTGPATASTTTTTVAGATGHEPASPSGLAFTSGPTPSGAGTDLGFFGTGKGPSDLAWILMIAGGFLLAAAGTLTLNGNRIRRWAGQA